MSLSWSFNIGSDVLVVAKSRNSALLMLEKLKEEMRLREVILDQYYDALELLWDRSVQSRTHVYSRSEERAARKASDIEEQKLIQRMNFDHPHLFYQDSYGRWHVKDHTPLTFTFGKGKVALCFRGNTPFKSEQITKLESLIRDKKNKGISQAHLAYGIFVTES